MISMAVLAMILAVVTSIADQTSQTWHLTTSKIQEFSAARTAFETISRQLGQATLNTYWDYVDASGAARSEANAASFVPASYARQSELRFASGATAQIAPSASAPRPFHGMFFQAPLGYAEEKASTGVELNGLDNLVNNCGFFVEFNSDAGLIPSALQNVVSLKPRYRFRLMEFLEPSNALSIYQYTSGNPAYSGKDWLANACKPLGSAPVHVLAENIVALILLPRLSQEQDPAGTALAPRYGYDSANGTNATTKNQLPPIVQLTMVAIDEPSALRLAALNGTNAPALFDENLFTEVTRYSDDLRAMEAALIARKLNYRIFTTTVTIRAAQWGGN